MESQQTIMELLVAKTLCRLSSYCKRIGIESYTSKLDGLLGMEIPADREVAGVLLQQLDERVEKKLIELGTEGRYSRFYYLVEECQQTVLAEVIMEWMVAQAYYPELKSIIAELFHPGERLTIEDVLRMVEVPLTLEEDYEFLQEVYESVSCILVTGDKGQIFFRRGLSMDERLMAYLHENDDLTEPFRDICTPYFAGEEEQVLYVQEEYAVRLEAMLGRVQHQIREKQAHGVLQILGESYSGRRYLLKHACTGCEQNLLFVDFSKLMEVCGGKAEPSLIEQLQGLLWYLKREMIFYRMGVCFYGIDARIEEEKDLERGLLYCLEQMKGMAYPVCVITEPKVHLIQKTEQFVSNLSLPGLSRPERKQLWDGYSNQYGLEGLDTRMAAGKYRLTAGEIAKAAKRLAGICQMEGTEGLEKKLARVCEEVLPSPVGGSIRQIQVQYTLDDLKLPELQKQNLLAILAQVNHRQLVYDDWGMEKKFAYGRNVSAIFVGAPGTGKTMAVHVLSSMLNLPLYKIDLSQVVDKYIGETEKKLEEIFNLAEKSNTILFFDEADSIFGKRSEVNDAKDKYANTEVSYILQRIEQYDGIVILASNYKKNIDEAFMRRMRYLVEFPMPDAKTRKEIWQGSFTEQVPMDDIDFDFLADTYELAGGIIKNIVLNAVFAAAAQGCDVGMKQILDSMKNERMKMGKTMISKDFGKYEYLYH